MVANPYPQGHISADHRYFYLPPLRCTAEEAAPFGVIVKTSPATRSTYQYDTNIDAIQRHLGSVSVHPDGRIVVVAHSDVRDEWLSILIGAALDGFRNKPSKRTGWRFCRRNGRTYWHAHVHCPIADDSAITIAIRAAQNVAQEQDWVLEDRGAQPAADEEVQ